MMQVTSPNSWEELYTGAQPKQIHQAGYMFVFHSMASMSKIYFDDFDFTYYKGDLLDETHYYPFGLTIDALSNQALGTEQKYKYNGIELNRDFDIETYDAFYRGLDPQIGRWNQIDPKSELLLSLTPYNSMSNNPISKIDPLGDKDYKVDRSGHVQFVEGSENNSPGYDRFISVYSQGDKLKYTKKGELKNSIEIKENQFKLNQTEDGTNLSFGENTEAATTVFNFLSDRSENTVEFSLIELEFNDSKKQNDIYTSHDKETDRYGSNVLTQKAASDKTIKSIKDSHNHPSHSESSGKPSGMKSDGQVGDIEFFKLIRVSEPNSTFYIRHERVTKEIEPNEY